MASLREVVSQYKEELRDGIAWLVFWKKGRSWKAEYFYLESSDDTLLPEDKEMLEKIQAIDPAAVVLNGYHCGYLGEDMSIAELASGVRCHYESGYNNITNFIQSHEHSLQEKKEAVMKSERSGYEIRKRSTADPAFWYAIAWTDVKDYADKIVLALNACGNGQFAVVECKDSQSSDALSCRHTGKEKKPMVSEITLKDRAGGYQRRMKAYRKAMKDYQKVRSRPLSAIS